MGSVDATPDSSLPHSLGPLDGPEAALPSSVVDGFHPGQESLLAWRGSASGARGRADEAGVHEILGTASWDPIEPPDEASDAAKRPLPHVGEEVMGLQLVRELGRGAFARVFLAEQVALAGRQVAVKLTRVKQNEPQTLAQLQHTHIVPVYSIHEDPVSGLRAMVMPYFGGATLARVLEKAGKQAITAATGHTLVTALDGLASLDQPSVSPMSAPRSSSDAPAAGALVTQPGVAAARRDTATVPSRQLGRTFLNTWADAAHSADPVGQPARHILEKGTYIQAVTWIAARLAEALAHAHQRGILHRDIKPSNVLIAADGQPMLLDFNLARDLKTNESGAVAYLGGTLPYMAPEHLDAFNVENDTPPSVVDERSDLYSMGVVLFEMLTGRHPFPIEPPGSGLAGLLDRMACERRSRAPSPRRMNGSVSRSLDAIVRHCLEPDPAARYPYAAQLAEDLQRELDDLPLKHTREPSCRERVAKWMRRHPRWASAGPLAALTAVAVIGLVALVLVIAGRLRGYVAERRYQEFQQGLVRAELLVHTGSKPGQNIAEAERVCKQTLALFDLLGSADWIGRDYLARLTDPQRAKLHEGGVELMLLFARLRAEQARRESSASRRAAFLSDAIRLLDRAEQVAEPEAPRALYEDRAACRELLGDGDAVRTDSERARTTPVRTPQDHYLLATSLAIEKRYEEAEAELKQALRLNPRHFWSYFALGICYDQRGQYEAAAGAYGACIALAPEFTSWTYLNRGLALSRLGRWSEAMEDYSEAIRLEPGFTDAYTNRGLALLNEHRYAEAVGDLNRGVAASPNDGRVWAARGAARAGLGDVAGARADFEHALAASPGDPSVLLSRGFALCEQDPEQSLSDFARVLEQDASSARAHYGRACVLGNLPGRDRAAIAAAEQALALDPDLTGARCALAVLLARIGAYDRAVAEADTVLREPASGPIFYAAACTYALASRSDETHKARALELLDKALERHYGRDLVDSDPDLDPIRGEPAFARLKK